MFQPEQVEQLKAPLNRSAVKARNQGGRAVSYIEGWHAIAEANRIFGFDGWTRETIDMKMVMQQEREIGAQKNPGWQVSYIAKVKVCVFDGKGGSIVREGYGAGHGIDRDLGQAHESAAKEAETDAMKRAMMTFGNPFGLALYDKEQVNVVDEDARVLLSEDIDRIEKAILDATDMKALSAVMKTYDEQLGLLYQQDEAKWKALSTLYRKRRKELSE